ncbi:MULTISPECIES: hypothetical protein [unclassified Haladaptatus]|uniref:hypothetical protein n=1 Tax=unclassified Haladaptatus TaxID=2622732 RepID=UPI0023E7B0FB|nr:MULTISPECIES: hypothetical protein [unclassified Haladaptatus]
MFALPMQVIDNFLLQYDLGQAIFFLFILATLGVLPLKSQKVLALQTTMFGVLFMIIPAVDGPFHWALLGLVLLLVGPVLLTTANR